MFDDIYSHCCVILSRDVLLCHFFPFLPVPFPAGYLQTISTAPGRVALVSALKTHRLQLTRCAIVHRQRRYMPAPVYGLVVSVRFSMNKS